MSLPVLPNPEWPRISCLLREYLNKSVRRSYECQPYTDVYMDCEELDIPFNVNDVLTDISNEIYLSELTVDAIWVYSSTCNDNTSPCKNHWYLLIALSTDNKDLLQPRLRLDYCDAPTLSVQSIASEDAISEDVPNTHPLKDFSVSMEDIYSQDLCLSYTALSQSNSLSNESESMPSTPVTDEFLVGALTINVYRELPDTVSNHQMLPSDTSLGRTNQSTPEEKHSSRDLSKGHSEDEDRSISENNEGQCRGDDINLDDSPPLNLLDLAQMIATLAHANISSIIPGSPLCHTFIQTLMGMLVVLGHVGSSNRSLPSEIVNFDNFENLSPILHDLAMGFLTHVQRSRIMLERKILEHERRISRQTAELCLLDHHLSLGST